MCPLPVPAAILGHSIRRVPQMLVKCVSEKLSLLTTQCTVFPQTMPWGCVNEVPWEVLTAVSTALCRILGVLRLHFKSVTKCPANMHPIIVLKTIHDISPTSHLYLSPVPLTCQLVYYTLYCFLCIQFNSILFL